MSKLIDLDDAVTYLRELMVMSKPELLREFKHHPDLCGDKVKKADLVVFAFERKFNSKAKPPIRGSRQFLLF